MTLSSEKQYQVQFGETLTQIAERHSVTANEIRVHTQKYHNYTINPEVQAGEIIYIPIKSNVATTSSPEEKTQTDTNTPTVAKTEPSQPTTTSTTPLPGSTRKVGSCVGESACSTEWVDLLHINYPDKDGNFTSQFIPLTAQEQKDYIAEEEKIAKKIKTFYEGSKKVGKMKLDRIYTEKRKLFEELNGTDDKYGEIFVIYEGQSNYSQLYEARRLGSSQRVYSYVRIKFFKDKIDTSKAYDIPALNDVLNMGTPWIRRKTYAEITADTLNMQTPKKDAQDAKEGNKELKTELDYKITQNIFSAIMSSIRGRSAGQPSGQLKLMLEASAKRPFWDMSLMEWKSKPNNTWDINGMEIKADLEAQAFRFAADASGEFKYDLVSKDFTIAGQVNSEANLVRGVAKFSKEWPEDIEDSKFTLSYFIKEENGCTECQVMTDEQGNDHLLSRQELDCGHFKVEASGKLEGRIGLSLILCGQINGDTKYGIPIIKGYHTTKSSGDEALYANGKVFAGLEGGMELEGELKWSDDLTDIEGEWKSLAKLGITSKVEFGAGLAGNFKVMNKNGVYAIRKNARRIWGPGGEGSIDFEVDKANLWTLFRFMYRNLMEVDYQRMAFIEGEAFNYWTSSIVYYMAQTAQATDLITTSVSYKEFITYFAKFRKDADFFKIRNLALNIVVDLTNDSVSKILFSPPETKGILIHSIISTGYWDQLMQSAVSKLLASAQTARELSLIFACINESGHLNQDKQKRQRDINYNTTIVGKYLYGGNYELFETQYKYIEANAKKQKEKKARQVVQGKVIQPDEINKGVFVNPMLSANTFTSAKITRNV